MKANTKEAEAAQAFFCALADENGKPLDKNIDNYKDFKEKYEKLYNAVKSKVETDKVSFSSIEQLLKKDNEWFLSSVKVANKFFEAASYITKSITNKFNKKGIDLYYLRDDKDIMGGFKYLFSYVNKQVEKSNSDNGKGDLIFNDLNKWSPADIYFATDKAKDIVGALGKKGGQLTSPLKIGKFNIESTTDFQTFGVLNMLVKKLIDDGDLLPLSLKKAPNDVVIKTINIVEGDVEKTLKTRGIKYSGYIFATKIGEVFDAKDVKIKINDNSLKLKFRDKGSTGGGKAPKYSYQGIIEGGTTSFDGGLGGDSIGSVIGDVVGAQKANLFYLNQQTKILNRCISIAKELFKKDKDRFKNASKKDKDITDDLLKFCKDYGGKKFKDGEELFEGLYDSVKAKKLTPILSEREASQWMWAKYLGGNLIKLLQSDSNPNKIVKAMIMYAGSRTTSSSPHYKAGDPSGL